MDPYSEKAELTRELRLAGPASRQESLRRRGKAARRARGAARCGSELLNDARALLAERRAGMLANWPTGAAPRAVGRCCARLRWESSVALLGPKLVSLKLVGLMWVWSALDAPPAQPSPERRGASEAIDRGRAFRRVCTDTPIICRDGAHGVPPVSPNVIARPLDRITAFARRP